MGGCTKYRTNDYQSIKYWVESYHQVIGRENGFNRINFNVLLQRNNQKIFWYVDGKWILYTDDMLVDGYSQDILENSCSLQVIL
jgi:hypothetical protein